ncbi:hypothetical protein ACHAQA_003510 [Verticillium albo-atrum]
MIPQGNYPFPVKPSVIPGSDGSGSILAVGSKVTKFAVGDRVCTHFAQLHQANPISPEALSSNLGGAIDGTLRRHAVFPESGVVPAPPSLTTIEASTLTVAPLTAWNAFYGLQSKALKSGDWVLTQGTGGVSLSAIQLAVAAGATVVATTSSDQKAEALKKLGAAHVVNYKNTSNWGEAARALTPNGAGFDHIIEVGGESSVVQSLKAIRLEGVITFVGSLTMPEGDKDASLLQTLIKLCTVRGILVGSRQQFEEMNRAIEAAKIKPVVDPKTFAFEDLLEAYQYQLERKHFGKVVVTL